MKRKAFTLMEILVVATMVPLVMLAVSSLFATFIRDIPRESRVVQQNATMLDMLRQIRRDVDLAVGLPEQFGDRHTDERTVLIEQPDVVVCYRFEDGRAVRILLRGQGPADPNERIWRMHDAVITWRPWVRDGKACAVEIHSHIQQWFGSLLRSRLANSQVFFINGLGKGREVDEKQER
jgi:type II secretory pathway pseudopilin PulG